MVGSPLDTNHPQIGWMAELIMRPVTWPPPMASQCDLWKGQTTHLILRWLARHPFFVSSICCSLSAVYFKINGPDWRYSIVCNKVFHAITTPFYIFATVRLEEFFRRCVTCPSLQTSKPPSTLPRCRPLKCSSLNMTTVGESSCSPPKSADEDKPVVVRVKRKASQSRLDALCELGFPFDFSIPIPSNLVHKNWNLGLYMWMLCVI